MRLVCDSCSALYTIEDGLVGTRDFRVSCKSCGKPIFVKSARQVTVGSTLGATHRVRLPGSALPKPSFLAAFAARHEQRAKATPVPGAEEWFISVDGTQRGPLSVHDMATMFEAGSLDWGTEVWREGLKGWRPARRDALLVTSVAGARGPVNDTTRLDAARSFLASEDTVVEPRPGHAKGRARSIRSARNDSTDATEKHVLELRDPSAHAAEGALRPAHAAEGALRPAHAAEGALRQARAPEGALRQARAPEGALRQAAKGEALPDLRPSARPQAWHSPENTAFREALGLPTDSSSSQEASAVEPPAQAPVEQAANSNPPGPTLADAFASATRLLEEHQADRAEQRPSGIIDLLPAHWLERFNDFYERHLNSHYLVALSSFAAGVLVTAMVLGRPVPSETPAIAQAPAAPVVVAQAPSAPVQPELVESALMPVATAQPAVGSALAAPAPTLRELPTVEDLRREVRKVAPDVRRCVEDPNAGVDVDIYLAGLTGRVRDVDVRSSLIPPGRAACIIHAVRKMEVSPFTRGELKLMHKFSW
ncbi:MAG: GYF domain-containing protein [Myxococcales bacterium]